MAIAFLLVRHPLGRPSPIFPEVVRLLRRRGVHVKLIYVDDQLTDLSAVKVECDLYVLKSGTEAALSVAGALHARGAPILNPYPVAAMCRDKVVATKILDAACVPVPPSYLGRVQQLLPLLKEGPLVIKPYRGSQGRGVQVVQRPAELLRCDGTAAPLFVQRYQEPDGLDWKIYCIGDEVFGVERPWPARTYREKLGTPIVVDAEVREIALRCASAFGMSLFGFDVVVSRGRRYVVDISSFPGFKGVPDAPRRLADYIVLAAEHATSRDGLLSALVGGEWIRT
jgi:ribosomal protein S6--L-glutamate ligase